MEARTGRHWRSRYSRRAWCSIPGFTRRSGVDIDDFSRRTVLPVEQRAPATISLSANSRGFGELTIERNATIKSGPGAGSISTPASSST